MGPARLPPSHQCLTAQPIHHSDLKSVGLIHDLNQQTGSLSSIIDFSSVLHLCFLPFIIKEKLTLLDSVAIWLQWLADRHGLYSEFDNSPLITRRTHCAYPIYFSNNSHVLRQTVFCRFVMLQQMPTIPNDIFFPWHVCQSVLR